LNQPKKVLRFFWLFLYFFLTRMERTENKRFVYEFGKFTLDPQEKTLYSDGVPLHLPAKEFETLLLLVENNGKALTKEEMMRSIWQDAFVEEVNLAKQISRLRKIINSNGAKLIETLPKHGYRFSADVRRAIAVAEEPLIIEKRTVKRLTVRVENEFEAAPPLALPPPRKNFSRLAVFVFLGLIILSTAILAWFWQSQKQIVKPDGSGIVFLTDASDDSSGANWVGENQIYFVRYVSNTRLESWRMNQDGSNQQRANTEIKNLLRGRWSPDGKKVVFVKEGDNKTFYLADSNGANEIVLPFSGGNMDWSPDGSQFVYQSAKNALGNHEVFLYTLATGENVRLTDGNFGSADPSFSDDGKQIAFTSFRDDNAEIYVMNADGSNVRRITNHPAFDNYPVFSPDGTQIAFQSNRENERSEIYLQDLEGDSPPVKIASHYGETGIHPKCWSADGTQILFWNNQNGKTQIMLSNVEPYPARLVLSDEKADLNFPRLAPDGKRILYEARLSDRSLELRLTELETKKTTTVYKTAPDYPPNYLLAPAWSPDGQKIAFADKSSGNSEVFLMNADGSGLQNLTNDRLPDSNPIFSPDGGEIIFTRDFYGEARLYRMNFDGSNQRLVTEKKGHNLGAAFSPDGSTLAFSGDRKNTDSRGLDIYLLDTSNPANEKRLTARRLHETHPAFSPDGKRIAFVSIADGNAEIYLMNSDGTGLFRLTRSKWEDTAPQFSADGKKLIFAANRSGKFAIYEIKLP
jgi:Tol biopolymer transport system component/DNA-binding winged helix-turn-helix (wHTH) protein